MEERSDIGRFRCAPVRGWPATAAWHPQSSWHSCHGQAAGTVVIAVLIGLPVTLAATGSVWTQDRHNERRLLQLQTRQAAAVIDSTVIGIVESFGAGVTIADDLQSNGDGTVSGQLVCKATRGRRFEPPAKLTSCPRCDPAPPTCKPLQQNTPLGESPARGEQPKPEGLQSRWWGRDNGAVTVC